MPLRTSDFDYTLPPARIAQTPIEPRDAARLLVVHRQSGVLEHRVFADLPAYLRAGDVLVANDSRVLPARLLGHKTTGGQVEILLLKPLSDTQWEALVRGKRLRPGTVIACAARSPGTQESLTATVIALHDDGTRTVQFNRPPLAALEQFGEMPLPPYIHEPLADRERYQTVYARVQGSAAAPTAGLHFTPRLIAQLDQTGVGFVFVTLHIGLDTFRPVQVEAVHEHRMHREWAGLPTSSAQRVITQRAAGGRCIAVGTTAVRVLESAARHGAANDPLPAFQDWTDLFITPGFDFRVTDALITNFHLPRSSLLMLVSAFAGKALIDHAYAEALRHDYRFFSFGDAMLIL
jgi:S-adenosylmethionine:tRNA ribosyltransferase-isomerase